MRSETTAEHRLLALVIPSAGRPWIMDTTGAELALELGVDNPALDTGSTECVRQARQMGIDLHLAATHAELPRWWSTALANDLATEAGLVLDRFRLHVPGAWRASELGPATLQLIADLYESPGLPALTVETERGRTTVACVPRPFHPMTLRTSNIRVVTPAEVQRAIRALPARPGWCADAGAFPDRVWLAVAANSPQRRRTVYIPAPEPIEIDPRGRLRPPAPPQFMVALQFVTPLPALPVLGPFATAAQADAAHDRAQAIVDGFEWEGSLETRAVILPNRLTTAAQIARSLGRTEYA